MCPLLYLLLSSKHLPLAHKKTYIAHSLERLATSWMVRGSNPGGGTRFFRTRPDRPWGPPTHLYNGYWVFPGSKAAEAWRWPPTSHLAPKLRKSKAIRLLPFWSFLACSRVNCYLYLFYIYESYSLLHVSAVDCQHQQHPKLDCLKHNQVMIHVKFVKIT